MIRSETSARPIPLLQDVSFSRLDSPITGVYSKMSCQIRFASKSLVAIVESAHERSGVDIVACANVVVVVDKLFGQFSQSGKVIAGRVMIRFIDIVNDGEVREGCKNRVSKSIGGRRMRRGG